MSNAKVQSATIQLKDHGGGVFGSKAVGGGSTLNISGTIAQGQTISISPVTGGFGDFGGEIVMYAKGDEGANGQQINGTATTLGERSALSATIVAWGGESYDTQEHFKFTTDNPRPGRTSSLRRISNVLGNERNGGFGYTSSRHDKTVYISYYRRLQSDPYDTALANIKQFYLYANGNGGEMPQAMPMVKAGETVWRMYNNISVGEAYFNPANDQGWSIPDDTDWHRWEFLFTLNDIGLANGVCKVWRDGVLGISNDAMKWQPDNYSPAATGWDDFRLGHMDTNIPNTFVDFSDVVLSSSAARVEIGNAATWGACTHAELQPIPETQWGDQSITGITLDKGALTSLQGSYLYVIKADGTPFNENGVAL